MSTLFVRGKTYYIGVPTRPGIWLKRTTGTKDKSLARSMARMIDNLGPKGKRAWVFLDAISGNRLSIAQLYDAYAVGALDDLQERMADIDLEPHVAEWLTVIGSHLAQDTIDHYELYVRSLVPADKRFPRSYLTHDRLVHWLATRPVGRSTKRKYHAAVSSLCEYLKSIAVLQRNPMREVKAPSGSSLKLC